MIWGIEQYVGGFEKLNVRSVISANSLPGVPKRKKTAFAKNTNSKR
jgi:hypothetical protein